MERDYRLRRNRPGGEIYLQGGTEHTHGITSSLLSNTAVRVGEILRSIVDRRIVPAPRGSTRSARGELLPEDVAVAGVPGEVLDQEQVDEPEVDLAEDVVRPGVVEFETGRDLA